MTGAPLAVGARDPLRVSRSLRLLSDERLSTRAGGGDRAAFAELYRRHHQRVFRYCESLLQDPEDAADALQGTMAKALVGLEGGNGVGRVRAWLFRIAHNEAIDLVRQRRTRPEPEDPERMAGSTVNGSAPDVATVATSREDLAQLVLDLKGLPERQCSALVMRELSDLPYADVAYALTTSPAAARQLVHEARSALLDARWGRDMECEPVREAVDDRNGRVPPGRRVRAHLATCAHCRTFAAQIRTRRAGLAAFAPPLVPAAAQEMLLRLLASDGGGAAVAAGGAGAAGGVAQLTIAGATKLAIAGAVAVVATGGGVALAEPELLRGADAPREHHAFPLPSDVPLGALPALAGAPASRELDRLRPGAARAADAAAAPSPVGGAAPNSVFARAPAAGPLADTAVELPAVPVRVAEVSVELPSVRVPELPVRAPDVSVRAPDPPALVREPVPAPRAPVSRPRPPRGGDPVQTAAPRVPDLPSVPSIPSAPDGAGAAPEVPATGADQGAEVTTVP